MRVEIRNLSKVFRSAFRGRVHALRDVNLQVEEGEFFVLLGPSGCGKSTLLNIVAGLDKPTRGEVYMDGRLVGSPEVSLPPKERGVAMVFQSYALYPHMSVWENIAFPLKIAGLSNEEIRRRVRETAEILGIEHLLRAKPSELSGGERQRVAIGRAIVRKPKVLLLDEPLSNLDAQLRIRMKEEMRRIHSQLGVTTLYVTHDQSEAMTLADRIAVMRDGRVEQVGEPLEIYRNPVNSFVAGFVGTPPMNIYRRKVLLKDGRRVVTLFGMDLEVELEREVVYVGFRPEEVDLIDGDEFEIGMVERLGDETVVHLNCEEGEVMVKLHGDHDVKVGKKAGIRIKNYHVFEE